MKKNKIKRFLISGFYCLLFLIVYEVIILLFSGQLNLYTIVLVYLPFHITSLIFDNYLLNIISTFILFFILGGLIGLLIMYFKK